MDPRATLHSTNGDLLPDATTYRQLVGVGTLGPGLAPLASRPNPRVLKGKGPDTSCPKNARPTLRSGIPRGLGPDTSRPRNAQPILRPNARVSHSPSALFNSSIYFPDRRLSQAKLPTSSPLYRREFTLELTPLPPTK